ncbi:MAG: hypothetical protein U9O83_03845 [Campylobacterota bacterium]|nr:hypothetical protein [Campylobacterota bacterium]
MKKKIIATPAIAIILSTSSLAGNFTLEPIVEVIVLPEPLTALILENKNV